MPAVELTVDQLAKSLGNLKPQEAERLLDLLDRQNLKARWQLARREYAEGKTVSPEEAFKDLD